MMKFGLRNSEIEDINHIFKKNKEIEKVIILGSRAQGNFRENSDVDLAIFGNIGLKEINTLILELDQLLLPYYFDLLIYKNIDNPDIKDHIKRCGKIFFEKK